MNNPDRGNPAKRREGGLGTYQLEEEHNEEICICSGRCDDRDHVVFGDGGENRCLDGEV